MRHSNECLTQSCNVLHELETNLLAGVRSGILFRGQAEARIQLDGDDFYIDPLFYERKLKRPVVVELKLGVLLCSGKNSEQIELFELGTAGIHVAEYLTVLPPRAVLRDKLHSAIETARARIEAKVQPRL